MNLLKKLYDQTRNLDRTYSWSLVGVLLGAPSLILAIYALMPSSVDLAFDVVSRTDLISVSERLPELKISFKDKDISESKEAIGVYVFKLQNRGSRGVRIEDFDTSFLPCVEFSSGMILQTEVIDASSDYLKSWSPQAVSTVTEFYNDAVWNRVEFIPKIVEGGDYVTFKVIVLHPESERPNVLSHGKVAGDMEVQISDGAVELERSKQRYAMILIACFVIAGAVFLAVLIPLVRHNNRFMRELRKSVEEFEESMKLYDAKLTKLDKAGPS